MALKLLPIQTVDVHQLAAAVRNRMGKVIIVDSRSFLEYNDNHVATAVNICCSKLMKRRLQQGKVSMKDLLIHCRIEADDSWDMIVYDQGSLSIDKISVDSFVYILLKKLVPLFHKVHLVRGGFLEFQSIYPDLCEDKTYKCPALTSLSQPCLPIANIGPTRILPFLYLGSEEDANNRDSLQCHGITYELNVSTNCPQPDFIQEGHFLRIPVNDSHSDRLFPYFYQTCQFIDKARESNGCVLVHCLAGISRSPTVAIAYVMRHLRLTCEEAYRYVKSKRATISPNFNFLGQLLEYEKQLKSENVLEKGPGDKKSPCEAVSTAPVVDSKKSRRLRTGSLALPLSFRTGVGACGSLNPSGASDLSPTSALARLHFEPPSGKENWSSESLLVQKTQCWLLPNAEKTIGTTRLAKTPESIDSFQTSSLSQINFVPCKTSSRQSTSKGVAASKSLSVPSAETRLGMNTPTPPPREDSSPHWCPGAVGLSWEARELARSDSVSTSGIGSEVSDVDVAMEAGQGSLGEDSSGDHDYLGVDDGVFCEGSMGLSPQPSPRLIHTPIDSPRIGEVGFRLRTEGSIVQSGMEERSCSGCSQFGRLLEFHEVDNRHVGSKVVMREHSASKRLADMVRSPEKRKSSEIPLSPERQQRGSEKRRSYVAGDQEEEREWLRRGSDNDGERDNNSSSSNRESGNKRDAGQSKESGAKPKSGIVGSGECESKSGWEDNKENHRLSHQKAVFCGEGLYRVQSCPGSIDAVALHSSSEFLRRLFSTSSSSSGTRWGTGGRVDLNSRVCGITATSSLRLKGKRVSGVSSEKSRNRFSCGSIDYGDLRRPVETFADLTNCSESPRNSSSSLAIPCQ